MSAIDKAVKSLEKLPTIEQIGWPDEIQPGDWPSVYQLAQDMLDRIAACEQLRMSGETCLQRLPTRDSPLYKPLFLYQHLRASAVLGGNEAKLGALLLAHLWRQIEPLVSNAHGSMHKGIPDGDVFGNRKRQIEAALLVRRLMEHGLNITQARAKACQQLGMTKRQVRDATERA